MRFSSVKKILAPLMSTALSLAFLTGCECEMDCKFYPPQIHFVGFDEQSLDTVVIRRYEKTAFGNRLRDSSTLMVPDNIKYLFKGDTAQNNYWEKTDLSPFPPVIEENYAYEVYLPSARRVFYIKDVVVEKTSETRPCYGCTMVKRFCFSPIKTITIDNVVHQINDLIWQVYLVK